MVLKGITTDLAMAIGGFLPLSQRVMCLVRIYVFMYALYVTL